MKRGGRGITAEEKDREREMLIVPLNVSTMSVRQLFSHDYVNPEPRFLARIRRDHEASRNKLTHSAFACNNVELY
jgi:hypothetical protein